MFTLQTMKKNFWVGLVIGLSLTTATAQTKTGDFMLGGQLSFLRQQGQTPDNAGDGITTETGLTFQPRFGFFVTNRVQLGFSTGILYTSKSNTYYAEDTSDNIIKFKNSYYNLTYNFGVFGSYYYPVMEKLYWVSDLGVNWGSTIEGDKVSTLFSADKPQQDRKQFLNFKIATGVQYFAFKHLSITAGITPFTLNYNYKRIVRHNMPNSKEDIVSINFLSASRSFFIGINYLILSDNEKNK